MGNTKAKVTCPASGAMPVIVWFRSDLRLADNPALTAAVARGPCVVPVFVWGPAKDATWNPGAASRWWLHQSLASLQRSLEAKGSRLVIRQGAAGEVLRGLIQETKACAVYWNRCYEPAGRARDVAVEDALRAQGIGAEIFNGSLLLEPWEVATKAGKPFRVFTPFFKTALKQEPPGEPLPPPRRIPAPPQWPKSLPLEALSLEPNIDWAVGMRDAWQPGEAGARERLTAFLKDGIQAYAQDRDRADRTGTSRLSPHLHFGEISPRQILWPTTQPATAASEAVAGSEAFLRQVYWREFAYHLLYHEPQTTDHPLRPEFAGMCWSADEAALRAWQRGKTGFPYIDAGMRELWHTGWMHNRVRMAAASFLVKDLLLPWQAGARWFWDTLVDADLANNTMGWQWTAGCGADAAPYFRVFNPVTQGERFDPQGAYVRRWVPELAGVPDRFLHRPWEAAPQVLSDAGVVLGETYPRPMVDHAEARVRALQAYERVKRA